MEIVQKHAVCMSLCRALWTFHGKKEEGGPKWALLNPARDPDLNQATPCYQHVAQVLTHRLS